MAHPPSTHCPPLGGTIILAVGTLLLAACHPSTLQTTGRAALSPAPTVSGDPPGSDVALEHGTLARTRVTHVAELLETRVSGVRVQRTGSGDYSVRIRGIGSLIGGGEPLWVLDGVPIDAAGGRGVSWINPNDIVRIVVLKDAASTAMYGSRGGNGVILLTSRRGR